MNNTLLNILCWLLILFVTNCSTSLYSQCNEVINEVKEKINPNSLIRDYEKAINLLLYAQDQRVCPEEKKEEINELITKTFQLITAEKDRAIKAELQALSEKDKAVKAEIQAENEKEKTFSALMLSIEQSSALLDSLLLELSVNQINLNNLKLNIIRYSEGALWSFASQFDSNQIRQTEFVNKLEKIASLYYRLGERGKGLNTWKKVVFLQRKLIKSNPHVLGYQSALAATLIKLSYFKQATGDLKGQYNNLEEAVSIYKILLNVKYKVQDADDPTISEDEFKKMIKSNYKRFSATLEELKKNNPSLKQRQN